MNNLLVVLDREIVGYIIEGLWCIWLAYWIYKSFGNKRTIYSQGRGTRLIYVGVLAFAWYAAENHGLIPRVRLFHENVFTQVGGILICAAGIALAIWRG